MNAPQVARLRKQKNPEFYCAHVGCLWRTDTRDGYKPCPKHQAERRNASETTVKAGNLVDASPSVDEKEVGRGLVGGTVALTLPDSRPHDPQCECHRCVFPW